MTRPPDQSLDPALKIEIEPISESTLVRDYLSGADPAGAFFQGSPHSLDTFRTKLAEVAARFGPAERARAARALTPTSERARERLGRFVQEGGAMVTTGQQAGLFTGPLYTIYKALTTVRLAEQLESDLGVLVIPVFWTASEDHDWEEANHTFVTVPGAGTRRLELPSDVATPLPMGERPLGPDVIPIIDELGQLVAGSIFEADLLAQVRAAYEPEKTVAAAFSELMRTVLTPFDLCLTDAADPALKVASVAVLQQALDEAAEHERVLIERTRAIAEAGYSTQVAVLEGATNVFFHGDSGRTRLYYDGDGFVIPETGRRLDSGAVQGLLNDTPGRLSPNVFLRPVVESSVFPTLAYVAGPGEISYFAQLTALFPLFGIVPPVVYPRTSLTLIEPPILRLLDKLGIERADLARPRHELVDEMARRSMPDSVKEALERLSRSVSDGYQDLIAAAAAVDPTLEDALASLRNQALARVGDSEKKVVRQLKRKEEIAVGQLDRARANLRPEGEPQDRVLNVLPFLARHGPRLLQEIANQIRPELR